MLQYVNNQLTIFGLPAIQLDIIDGADIVDQTQNRQILRCFIALLDQRQVIISPQTHGSVVPGCKRWLVECRKTLISGRTWTINIDDWRTSKIH